MNIQKGGRIYRRTEEIIEALQEYRQKEKKQNASVLVNLLTDYLIEFFQKLDTTYEDKWEEVYDIGPHRGILLLRAIMLLEESNEEWVKKYRDKYENFWQGRFMRSSVFTESFSTDGVLLKMDLRGIMEEAMPERGANYNVLDGAWLALDVYFNKFVEKVYIGQGMHKAIMNAKFKGVGGIFGQTKLLTYDIAGRLMLTFSRGDDSITFIKTSDDGLALGAGIQSCHTDLVTALTMIDDVIANYKPDRFIEDSDISMTF